jgi:hypothetical protein
MTETTHSHGGEGAAPNRIRIHEAANRLGISAGDLMHRARTLDIPARSVLQALDLDDLRRVLEDYQHPVNGGNGATPDPALILEFLTTVNGHSDQRGEDDHSDLPEIATPEWASDPAEAESALTDQLLPAETETEPALADPALSDQTLHAEQPETEPVLAGEPPPDQPETDDALDDDHATTWRLPTNRQPRRREIHSHRSPALPQVESAIVPPGQPTPSRAPLIVRKIAMALFALVKLMFGLGKALLMGLERRLLEPTDPDTASPQHERRRILRVAVAMVTGTAILATTFAILRPMHAAESEVIVTIGGLGSSEIERELQSFIVVAESQTVLAPVADELGMPLSTLQEAFDAEIVGDSTVLRLVVTDPDPGRALLVNEAIVASYLAVANRPTDQAQSSFLESQISDVSQELETTSARLEVLDAALADQEATRRQIETDRAIAQSRLANLESRLVDLLSSSDPATGAVSFVEIQVTETRASLDALAAELDGLDSPEAAAVRSEAEQLEDTRVSLRAELGELEALEVDMALNQIARPRVAVLAPAHALDDAVGLTPPRALALGILVGGVMAFAWVVLTTQLRKRT